METAVSSSSPLEALARWRRTRLPWVILAAAALYLWAAGLAAGRPEGALQALTALAAAAVIVAQFRLWDDLADVPGDRQAHPDRVLVRAASLAPFRGAAATLAAATAVLLAAMDHAAIRLAVFALLCAGLLLWYRRRRSFYGFANAQVVLAKYPVFVALVAVDPGPTAALLLAMLAVYLSFSAHEILHDAHLAARRGATAALAAELAALCATAALMALALAGRPLAASQWLLAGACAAGCAWIFYRHRAAPGAARYAIFAAAAPAMIGFALRSGP